MQMRNRLSRVRAVVDGQTKTPVRDPFQRRQLLRRAMNVAEQTEIGFGNGRDVFYVLAGDDQDVNRGLGLNVPKGQHPWVFVDHLGFQFTGRDFTKKASVHRANYTRLSEPGKSAPAATAGSKSGENT